MTHGQADAIALQWVMLNRHRIITPAARKSLADLLLRVAAEARANEAGANLAWRASD